MRAGLVREIAIVVAGAVIGVLVIAVVVLGPAIAEAHSGPESTRVIEVLQPADAPHCVTVPSQP